MLSSSIKPTVWMGTTRKDVRAFPTDARARTGYEVYRVQSGLDPTDWKPIAGVGDGVKEIRVHTGREHRLIYVAKFAEALYVLHAFEKNTRKTTKADIEIARNRYRDLMAERAQARTRPRRR